MNSYTISISIPVYNDMHAVQELMTDLHQNGLYGENISYLLIDDGSKDETRSVIEQLSIKYDSIKLIIHDRNYGFGYTIKEAITTPSSDFILFLSGDNQFHADVAIRLIKEIHNNTDYILGVRDNRSDNLYRRFASKTYNLLISLLAKEKVRDVNSVFIVRRKCIDKIKINSKSAFIHAEIFLQLRKIGAYCSSINIPHYPRKHGRGSGGKLKVILPTIRDFMKYLLNEF